MAINFFFFLKLHWGYMLFLNIKNLTFSLEFRVQRSQKYKIRGRLKSNYHFPLHPIHFLHVALILFRILQTVYCSIFTMTSSSILFRGTPRGFVPEMQQLKRRELKTFLTVSNSARRARKKRKILFGHSFQGLLLCHSSLLCSHRAF